MSPFCKSRSSGRSVQSRSGDRSRFRKNTCFFEPEWRELVHETNDGLFVELRGDRHLG